MPDPLTAFLILVGAVCIASLSVGVYVDHVRWQACRSRRITVVDEIHVWGPERLSEVRRVIGGHRGPGVDR